MTVLATPGVFTEFSRQRGLAPDGRSKSFAETADGVAWSEGVGMLVLERLSDAQRNGHPILATIKGSAVNQDGASNGLTAPNGPSQERVIRQALANARLSPQDVDAVEAHGTGTTLGDPIEAGALLATYGQEREEPLKLGSLKSNIGHTQAAAGVAGVIKTVMAMRERLLPKTLHVDQPSSKIDWSAGKVELLTEAVPWQANGRPRRAGVSSFGISGTNAHVILEEAPEPSSVDAEQEQGGEGSQPLAIIPLALSAKSEPALNEAAERLASHLRANPQLDLTDVAYSLATTRSAFEQRAVVLGSEREELLEGLGALGAGVHSADLLQASATETKLAYLLTGQGSQRVGMGKALHETYPTYAETFDEICELFDAELKEPLKEIVFGTHPEAKELLDHTSYAQPALFGLEVALHRLLSSWGLRPALLCGHSIGEIAAAQIASVLSLPDAVKLVSARAKLMGELPQGGVMVAIEATEAEATEAIASQPELSIAAINASTSVVLSGEREAIAQIEARFREQGKKTKRLAVSHAFHSPLMEPILEPFAEVAKSLEYAEPKIPIVSNLSGELLSAEQATDPAYWVAHVREPVRFADAVETLHAQGAGVFLELGPDPVLSAMAAECLASEDPQPALIATLREGSGEPQALTLALAQAHAWGASVDWDAFFSGSAAKRVPLPTYPFQRKRYWLNASAGSADASSIGQGDPEHPLLGAVIEDPQGEGLTLTGRISLQTHAWLADHMAGEAVLLPGTAFLEVALRAAQAADCELIEELTLQAPLILPETGGVALQVSVGAPDEDGTQEISIHSRPEGEEAPEWTCHAQGTLATEAPSPAPALGEWPPPGAQPLEVTDLYERLAEAELHYGPTFQGLSAAWAEGEQIYAEVSLPEEHASAAAAFAIHPALLDAALHGIGLGDEGAEARLPFSWGEVALQGRGATALRVKISPQGKEGFSIFLADQDANSVAQVGSLALRALDSAQLQGKKRLQSLFGIEWSELELEPEDDTDAATAEVVLERFERSEETGDLARAARASAERGLVLVQQWLEEERVSSARLAILTQGAVATSDKESADPSAASLWGLIRSAQSEHPDRFVLID